jgi:superfamily II DNA or RNA helicase
MENINGQPGRTEPVRLRPYQENTVRELEERLAAGVRRLIIVAPTGSGKTTIAAFIIAQAVEQGSRVLFMAHRRELITQAYNRLRQLGVPEDQLGVLMGQDRRNRPGAPVQVASVDTLRNRAKPLADIVFTDEAHRSSAKTYKDIASFYPQAIHLGLTATPFRANGEGLSDAFDDLLVVATPRELIAQGHLVEPRVFTVPKELLPDLSSVKTKRGDYDQRALAEAVNSKSLVGNLVEHWHRHAQGVRTVAFAVSVEHSQHIAAQFRQAGVAAEHLDGTTPTEERDATLARLARGETRIVSNVGLFGEGWDLPSVKCAILARPTRSTGLYLQQAGRIMRPWKGQQAIILDHGGCVLEHGLPQDDRTFTLEGTKKKGGKSSAPRRTCPDCSAELPLGVQVCPMCGAVLNEKEQVPQEQDGNLVEVTPEDLKRIELARLCAVARQRGYKPGWVYYRYKEKFGEAPPRRRSQPTVNTRALTDVLRNAARSGGRVSWSSIDAAVQGAR